MRNFRSHEVLLSLPNRLFYENELECCANRMLVDTCLRWEGLPTQGVPLFFEGMIGKDARTGSSPSWFNLDEAMRVVQIVRDLLAPGSLGHGGQRVREDMIGVITPYARHSPHWTTFLVELTRHSPHTVV